MALGRVRICGRPAARLLYFGANSVPSRERQRLCGNHQQMRMTSENIPEGAQNKRAAIEEEHVEMNTRWTIITHFTFQEPQVTPYGSIEWLFTAIACLISSATTNIVFNPAGRLQLTHEHEDAQYPPARTGDFLSPVLAARHY
jgi:hypothetical protein